MLLRPIPKLILYSFNNISNKIKFTEYNVAKDSSKREEMFKKSNGAKTIPQIFIGEYHVGGNVELQTLEKEGRLNSLLGI